MLQIKVDPHTHTIFSGHAYGTVYENALYASRNGLEGVAITDHFSYNFHGRSPDFPVVGHFQNVSALPEYIEGVRVFPGVEADILDFNGNLMGYDRKRGEAVFAVQQIVIASIHGFAGHMDGSETQNTQMYVNALTNPKVHILGHCERPGFVFDIVEVVRTARAAKKLIEINEHSLDLNPELVDMCRKIAICCAEMDVQIVVSSDAHSPFEVGRVERSIKMLEEIDFPERLVANRSLESFLAAIGQK